MFAMESAINHQEELQEEEDSSSLGVGRSYECVFCKRGFNTAQALGGHMNIHRKDRAGRNKQPSSSSNSAIMNSNNTHDPRFYHHSIYQPHHHQQQQQFLNQRSSSSAAPPQPFLPNNQSARFNPFGFDQWSMSFNMPCGSSAHVDDVEKRRRGVSQEEELDLELRLGGP